MTLSLADSLRVLSSFQGLKGIKPWMDIRFWIQCIVYNVGEAAQAVPRDCGGQDGRFGGSRPELWGASVLRGWSLG